MEALDFDVSLVATEWFLCLFSKSLPSEVRTISGRLRLSKWKLFLIYCSSFCYTSVCKLSKPCYHVLFRSLSQTTLRVWDVLFYEGAKVLFHVALAIFKVIALAKATDDYISSQALCNDVLICDFR